MGSDYDDNYDPNNRKRKKKKKRGGHHGLDGKKHEANDADVENLYSADPSNTIKLNSIL